MQDKIEKIRMKDLPLDERPYEKFKMYGASRMSDSELIAIILRSGTKRCRVTEIASKLLLQGGLINLIDMKIQELKECEGIGEIKAIQLKALCELAVRFERIKRKQQLDFSSPEKIAAYARCSLKMKNFEVLKVYYLSNTLKLIYEEQFTSGELGMVHNHPGGNFKPSLLDIKTTNKIMSSLKEIDAKLEDHIIISDDDYLSMRQEKILNFDI